MTAINDRGPIGPLPLAKRCTFCKCRKPLYEFSRNRSKPDGRGNVCRACMRAYRRANRDRARIAEQRYLAHKNAVDFDLTPDDLRLAWGYFGGHCPYCGQPLGGHFHLDHVWPVSKGGPTTPDNVLPVCPSCNSSKKDTDPLEWLRSTYSDQRAALVILEVSDFFQFAQNGPPEGRRATII